MLLLESTSNPPISIPETSSKDLVIYDASTVSGSHVEAMEIASWVAPILSERLELELISLNSLLGISPLC